MKKIQSIFNFDNIGTKIKNLTKWSCWITILLVWIAAAVVTVFGLVYGEWYAPFVCFVPAVVASFIIWIGSWSMYAFGEFVEKTTVIERNTRGETVKSETQAQIDNERVKKLEDLRAKGLITEEEYQAALKK